MKCRHQGGTGGQRYVRFDCTTCMPVVPIPRRRDVDTAIVADAAIASGTAAASAEPAVKTTAAAASASAVATGSVVVLPLLLIKLLL